MNPALAKGTLGAAVAGTGKVTYTLPVTVTSANAGEVAVKVEKAGYLISGSPKTVSVIYYAPAITDPVIITFDANGGSAVAALTIEKGTGMGDKLPTSTKAGFVFDGWWVAEGKEYLAETEVGADVTVTARWVTTPANNANFEVPFTGKIVRNPEAVTGAYSPMVSIDVGEVPLAKYSGLIIDVKFLGSDGTTVVTDWGSSWSKARQLIYRSNDGGSGTMYNFAAGQGNQTITDGDDSFLHITTSPFAVNSGAVPSVINSIAINSNAANNNDTISFVQVKSVTFIWRAAAAAPAISGQPTNKTFELGGAAPELSVTATSPDSGVLTYQWYSAATETGGEGTLVTGATNATFTPAINTATAGTYFYYVVVTNTNNNATETKTAATTSNRAKVSSEAEKPVDPNVNLEIYTLPANSNGDDNAHSGSPDADYDDGKLTISYNGPFNGNGRQSAFIPLSAEQQKKIREEIFAGGGKVKIKVDATWTPATWHVAENPQNFRFGLAINAGSNWNHSDLKFSFENGAEIELGKNGGAAPTHIIIQVMNVPSGTKPSLEIRSITFVWP